MGRVTGYLYTKFQGHSIKTFSEKWLWKSKLAFLFWPCPWPYGVKVTHDQQVFNKTYFPCTKCISSLLYTEIKNLMKKVTFYLWRHCDVIWRYFYKLISEMGCYGFQLQNEVLHDMVGWLVVWCHLEGHYLSGCQSWMPTTIFLKI